MAGRGVVHGSYVGWVAYLGGRRIRHGDHFCWIGQTPIYEAVPRNPYLASLAPGARSRDVRPAGRQTLDWKDLPHERVMSCELYCFRDLYRDQPVVRIDLVPEMHGRVRWIHMKETGVVVQAGAGGIILEGGQQRLGVTGWKLGFWNTRNETGELVTVRAGGVVRQTLTVHPCAPKPEGGLGLAPYVLGLTEEET